MDRSLSIVVSVYSEEKVLEELYRRTTHVLEHISWNYELFFINGDDRGRSQDIPDCMAASDSRVRMIGFSMNLERETVMITGLDYSRGDGIICMDADLQYPPECIPDVLVEFGEGYQVINIVCIKNRTAGLTKNVTPSGFYWLISQISDVYLETDAPDFFAASRHVTQVLGGSYRKKVRFFRGYVQNAGFKKTVIEYEARARIAGESKYNIKKLFVFSINTILCLSNMPLRLGIYAGIFSVLLSLVVMMYMPYARKGAPSGYATIVVLIYFMFAMMFVIIGIVGEYIMVLFMRPKDRPVYIMGQTEDIVQRESAGQNKQRHEQDRCGCASTGTVLRRSF